MKKIAIHCSHDKLVDPAKLKPNPNNPNLHTDAEIELLARMIERQGWRAPIVVSKRSGFIVSGHGRWKAGTKLGAKVVPVNYQAFRNASEENAHLVADNRVAQYANMDEVLLRDLFKEINPDEIDLTMTGFTDKELEKLIAEVEPDVDFQDIPSDIETNTTCPKCGYKWNKS